MPTQILRIHPRSGVAERPVETDRGFELVDRRIAGQKNLTANATFVRSLEEAAYLVEQGFAIRMGAPGKRASLISPKGLKIVRS